MTNYLPTIKPADFSKDLRKLRQEVGLTQEKLAVLLGVTCLTVNRWENGRTQPSPLAVKQIQNLLQSKNLIT